MENQPPRPSGECLLWRGNRYFTQGSGLFVVAQHVGVDGYSADMQRFVSLLVDRGCFVASLHLYARDNTPHDFGCRNDEFLPWIRHLRELHGLGKPRFFAHCRGGLQLLNFWCSNPEEADRGAFVSTVTDPYVYPRKNNRLSQAYGAGCFDAIYRDFCPNERAEALRGKDIRIWHNREDDFIPMSRTTDIFAGKCGASVVEMQSVGHAWNHEYDEEIAGFLTA